MNSRNLSLSDKVTSLAKRAGHGLLAAGITLSILVANIPHASAATTAPGARVSFTFDDGMTSALTQAAPTLQKHGFTGTSYVITGCVGMNTAPNECRANTEKTYMSWEEINQLKNNYGWEIGSHTVNHPLLASSDPEDQPNPLTVTELRNELNQSKADLAAHGIDAKALATPYGDWTPPVLAEIAKVYSSHRGFADSIDQNADGVIEHGNGFPYNDYLLYDLPVQVGVPVAQVKAYIDQTIANNQWLILSFHDIQASATNDEYDYLNNELDQIAAYVKSKGVPVVNVTDGLAGGTNLLPGSGFDNGIADGWATDASSTITPDSGDNGSFPGASNSVHLTSDTVQVGHLFSPQIAIDPAQKYFIKSFLNVNAITVAAGNEVAFIVDEYDANGTYLTFQYRKAETSVWLSNLNFEYTPTNANVRSARLQIVVTANSGINAYLDNVQWFAQVAPTVPVPPVVTPPAPGGGLGGGTGKNGDLNNSGRVDITDLSILLSHWGQSNVLGNLDGNPIININDLSILLANWG